MARIIGGKYELDRSCILGHGAFAIVFKGVCVETKQPVAIKQISLKGTAERFSKEKQKEISILKQLRHENIVRYYDYFVESKRYYAFLVMEYCDGGDLSDYLLAKKTLSEETIRYFLSQIADAVDAIHAHNVIHRDLKPQNILLVHNHASLTSINPLDIVLKIADFGFARELTGEGMAHTLCGSPLYMAPEVLLSKSYDAKVDLWSIGTIIYQCKYGKAPFTAQNPEALKKRYQKDKLIPVIEDGTSKVLADLLIRLLKKEPKERIGFDDFFAHPFITGKKMADGSPGVTTFPTVSSDPVPIRKPKTSIHSYQNSPSSSPDRYQHSINSAGSSPSSNCPPSFHHVNSSGESSSLQYSEDTEEGFVVITPRSPGSSRRRSSNVINIPFSRKTHSTGNQVYHQSPSPSTSPFKNLMPLQNSPNSIPEESYVKSHTLTPPSFRRHNSLRGNNQVFQASPVSIKKRHSQDGFPTRYSMSPSGMCVFGDHRHTPPHSSSPHKHTSLENSIVSESMLLKSKIDCHSSRSQGTNGEDGTRYRSNTLPRVARRGVHQEQPKFSSLKEDDLFDDLSKDFLLSQFVEKEETSDFEPVKPAFSSSSSNKSSAIFNNPFLNCATALDDAITIVDEVMRMARQRENNFINFSKELFTMNMSGSSEQSQRYAEQLVLYMKANNILAATLKDVELEVARSSQEPSVNLTREQERVRELQKFCHGEAVRAAHLVKSSSGEHLPSVKAEKLLYVQAMDLCQAVALDESFGSQEHSECVKRYKIANCILKHLENVVKSQRDKIILQKYIEMLEQRITHVSSHYI
ncbi:serine/threonine-protein kinase unc-51-like isoform X2 [Dysidea avara]|uniref:serine/threonine-protein kinase unc-51-like isoform X2 n=1 Tax=Dysidea avara TaxID=196820 RepID=UPI003324CD2C